MPRLFSIGNLHVRWGDEPNFHGPIMDMFNRVIVAIQKMEKHMTLTLADLDTEIATLAADEKTAADTISAVLTSLVAKQGSPAPDLTSEIESLKALDAAFAKVASSATAADAPQAPPSAP